MPETSHFQSSRVLQLMKRIEVEKDRETLAQLFLELNLLANENEQGATPKQKVPLRWLRSKRQRKAPK